MANEAETAIYNRLAAAPTFHPADVSLLPDDWALEPGDIVTVTHGQDSYSVPVYSLDLTWKGATKTEIQSTGNQKRESLAALQRRHYAGGYGGMASALAAEAEFKEFETHFEQTDQYFSLLATQNEWDELAQTGHVTAYSQIVMNSSSISSEVTRATGAEGGLSSRITQNADSIALVVDNGSIKAAQIVAAINGASSSVTISADHIVLDGDAVANSLASKDIQTYRVRAEKLSASDTLSLGSSGALTLWNQSWSKQTLAAGSASGVSSCNILTTGGNDVNLEHYHSISVSESNGVVTITQGAVSATAGSDSFNIANTNFYQSGVLAARNTGWASAAGSIVWPSAGSGSSIAITYPDQTYGDTLTAHYGMVQSTWSGSSKTVKLYSDDTSMGSVAEITVDGSGLYGNGWNDAAAAIVWPSSGTSSGATFTFPVSGGSTDSKAYVLTTGSWSSGSLTVRMREGSASGTTVADTSVSMPTSGTLSGVSASTAPAGGYVNFTGTFTVGGKAYSISWRGQT